jgi:hypothetical protein
LPKKLRMLRKWWVPNLPKHVRQAVNVMLVRGEQQLCLKTKTYCLVKKGAMAFSSTAKFPSCLASGSGGAHRSAGTKSGHLAKHASLHALYCCVVAARNHQKSMKESYQYRSRMQIRTRVSEPFDPREKLCSMTRVGVYFGVLVRQFSRYVCEIAT